MAEKSTVLLKPSAANFRTLLSKGYSIRELLYWGIRLKLISKIKAVLLYSFYKKGRGVDIDATAVIQAARYIELGSDVFIQRNAWLTVPLFEMKNVQKRPYIVVGSGTRIGPSCHISAANGIEIGKNVLFGPNVCVMDHRHEYSDANIPISCQGIAGTGKVLIEENCWIATNVVIYGTDDITIGRGSVIAANSVVRESVPSYSLVAGNPAKVLRKISFGG